MVERQEKMKGEWESRARRLGYTKRAVLFKRMPGWVNERIHRRHLAFVIRQLGRTFREILDVGCGYGRISSEIKLLRPDIEFRGVELSSHFAAEYEKNIGPCFNGPVSEYEPDTDFDMIIVVTLLMYLEADEQRKVLDKLWGFLRKGGVLVCIESAVEISRTWRRLTGKASASPTGGDVGSFEKKELISLLSDREGAVINDTTSVLLAPLMPFTAVHHGAAILKKD